MIEGLLSTSKMGFGCMRLPQTDPNDATAIDIPQFCDMVDAFLAAGNTYFDTAYVYHDGASETAMREALVKVPSRFVHHRDEVSRVGAAQRTGGSKLLGHVA